MAQEPSTEEPVADAGRLARSVFIFPSPQQVATIERYAADSPTPLAVVLPSRGDDRGGPVEFFGEDEFVAWSSGRSGDRWLCCGELAVYFVAKHRDIAGELSFNPICLDMLTKLRMGEELGKAGLSVLPKQRLSTLLENGRLEFPLIVKPNFGFASALVKRIRDRAALDEYVLNCAQMWARSPIAAYQREYIGLDGPPGPDNIIVEPDCSHATFYSVPFHVRGGAVEGMYPGLGERYEGDELSDFQWRAFRVPDTIPESASRLLREDFAKLASYFELKDGVFEAEFLFDQRRERLYVLEFSPRITGGAIPELIQHATGVDLRDLEVALFLRRAAAVAHAQRPRSCVYLREEVEEGAANASGFKGRLLARYEKRIGARLFHDSIYAVE
jgi:hypothetical protein